MRCSAMRPITDNGDGHGGNPGKDAIGKRLIAILEAVPQVYKEASGNVPQRA